MSVALLTDQRRVEDWPRSIVEGSAANREIDGFTGGGAGFGFGGGCPARSFDVPAPDGFTSVGGRLAGCCGGRTTPGVRAAYIGRRSVGTFESSVFTVTNTRVFSGGLYPAGTCSTTT